MPCNIMFLTLEKFLSYFPEIKPKPTRLQFSKKFKVNYKKQYSLHDLFSLRHSDAVIKTQDDMRIINKDRIIDYFYDVVICNRWKYLSLWYTAYFSIPNEDNYIWEDGASLEISDKVISTQKNDASKHMIRNLFYLELFDYTKVSNTVKSRVSFWQSLLNMYNKLELEDRFFCKSSLDLMLRSKNTKRELATGIPEVNYNALFYLYQQYQPKASIFNPYAIYWILARIYTRYSTNAKTLFSPVLSWGSYVPAFMNIPSYTHYVGIDVMPSVCKKIVEFAEWYARPNKKVDIIMCPSEKLHLRGFHTKYAKYFDSIIVCPPYYDMEIYHEGDQSIKYSYHEWLTEYWEATVQLCKKVASKNAVFGVIINDYYSLTGEKYMLTEDFNAITSKYFKLKDIYYLQNRVSPLRMNGKDRMERLYIYQNKSGN
jgi:hypothetical protein